MKSIVVGFKDEAGRTPPVLIHGPETPDADQWRTILDAKQKHIYPEGFKRVELHRLELAETAIFVSATAGAEREAYMEAQAAAQQARLDAIKAKSDAAKALAEAKTNQAKANINRAQAQSNLIAVQNQFNAATKAKSVVKEHQNRLDAAQAAFEVADKAWNEAKETLAKLTAPK
jgi:hypothetical protein